MHRRVWPFCTTWVSLANILRSHELQKKELVIFFVVTAIHHGFPKVNEN